MTRKIEMANGEFFAVSDKVILVSKYESVLGMVSKLGTTDNDRVAYMLTFEGKLNNKDRTSSVTVALDPAAASDLVGDILNGLEMLVKIQKEGPQ
jgi:hypothetical protein